VGAVLGVAIVCVGGYAVAQGRAFDESVDRLYTVPLPAIEHSTDSAMIARGKHLAEAVSSCTARDCHGTDGAGGKLLEIGPVGTMQGPNITPSGIGGVYTDAELARLIRHGIKKDGRSVRFMPAGDFCWLPDSDIAALISYVRTLTPSDKPNGPVHIGLLGKVLDRKDFFPLDIARRIDHDHQDLAPPPSPTPAYGKYLARLCSGCHGPHMSGGPIPGAPPSMAVPGNITPHESGLGTWTYDDFLKLLATGMMKNGKQADPMMPYASLAKMDDTEKRALWEYLRTVPPLPFGNR
jgi:hypothetical protein